MEVASKSKAESLPPTQPQLRGALKLKPAAQYLSVSPITVRRLVERGQLKANRSTRHLLFPIKELDRFLET
jgi:excisionase family DNA binding protein